MSIVGDPQFEEVTITTDASGYFNHTFANHIDACMASVNQPQAGTNAGIVGASVVVTGDKTVKVRCWEANGTSGVRTCQSEQVTVTLIGLTAA
jgi:hypothetical protein